MAAGDMRAHSTKRGTVATTDDTPTLIPAVAMVIPDLSVAYVHFTGFGVQTTAAGVTIIVDIIAVVRRWDADATVPADMAIMHEKDNGAPAFLDRATVDVLVDETSHEVRFEVTGDATRPMRWEVRAEYRLIEQQSIGPVAE